MTHEQLYQTILECSAYISSGILIMLLLWSLKTVRKGTNFQFLTVMISLLLTSNMAFILYTATYEKRQAVLRDSESYSRKISFVALSMTLDCLRYASF